MRGYKYLAGIGVLGATLATLAWAQQPTGERLPRTIEQPEGRVVSEEPSMPQSIPSSASDMEPARQAPVAYSQPAQPMNGGGNNNMQAQGMAEEAVGPGPTPDVPTGRQEPAVSMEWIGPPSIKLGRPTDYTIAVRNVCGVPVQQVMVRVRVPQGMGVNATEPKAIAEGNVLMWELGTMMPKQERNLHVRIQAEGKGNMRPQAWVTFTGSTGYPIKVTEPKLVLKATAPERVMVGDAATFVLTVNNPGDGPAEQVKIHAELSEGLEHVKGRVIDFEVGNLAAGESRSVQLICATKMGGVQVCRAVAESDGLRSEDQASVNVIMPRIELVADGPKLRYLDRPATYVFKVTNPGDAAATNVSITDVIPPGFKFVGASDGGRHDFSTRTVTWFLGELGPNQTREVKLETVAINPGDHLHKVAAKAARGLSADSEVITKVQGLSAILLEVVDTEDPIEVGAETSYEIRVTNTGSSSESDLKLICLLPDQMEFKSAQGPVRHTVQGKQVIFEGLPKLAPRADAIFRVAVKTASPGSVRFTTQITSANLKEPVIEQEATRIYADQ